MAPSTTTGLKPKRPLVAGIAKYHACSSRATFDRLICLSAEYCASSAPPP